MPEDQQKTFGELIQEYLKLRGWSNAELARRTDFSATYIGNLIRDYSPGTKSGKPTRLPVETVDKIARALDVPLPLARKSAGLAPPDERDIQETKSREIIESALLLFFSELPPIYQADVLAIVQTLHARHAIDKTRKISQNQHQPAPAFTSQLGPTPGWPEGKPWPPVAPPGSDVSIISYDEVTIDQIPEEYRHRLRKPGEIFPHEQERIERQRRLKGQEEPVEEEPKKKKKA